MQPQNTCVRFTRSHTQTNTRVRARVQAHQSAASTRQPTRHNKFNYINEVQITSGMHCISIMAVSVRRRWYSDPVRRPFLLNSKRRNNRNWSDMYGYIYNESRYANSSHSWSHYVSKRSHFDSRSSPHWTHIVWSLVLCEQNCVSHLCESSGHICVHSESKWLTLCERVWA